MPFMRPGGILCAGGWAEVTFTNHFRTNKIAQPDAAGVTSDVKHRQDHTRTMRAPGNTRGSLVSEGLLPDLGCGRLTGPPDYKRIMMRRDHVRGVVPGRRIMMRL
jgi:hypothetical protein